MNTQTCDQARPAPLDGGAGTDPGRTLFTPEFTARPGGAPVPVLPHPWSPTVPLARHACQLPNHPESVGRARRWVRALLAADGCCEDVTDTALLIMSELATNGLIHGSQHRSDTITVVCELDWYILTVGVIDYGADQPVILDATEDAEFGRGLALVEDLADDWGQEPCDGGKLVYARLKLPQDCAATA